MAVEYCLPVGRPGGLPRIASLWLTVDDGGDIARMHVNSVEPPAIIVIATVGEDEAPVGRPAQPREVMALWELPWYTPIYWGQGNLTQSAKLL